MPSSTPHDEIDAAIIARIQGGFSRFYEIWPAITPIAAEHIKNAKSVRSGVDRLVDRRLQAMRKRGKIQCVGQRWYVL